MLDETRGKVKIDADDTDGKDVGGDAGEGRRGVDDGTEHPPGTDVFGGPGAPDASYDWALLGGGVSGALKAAELYSDGYFVSLTRCPLTMYCFTSTLGSCVRLCFRVGGEVCLVDFCLLSIC